jgi:general secretion pathway protein D
MRGAAGGGPGGTALPNKRSIGAVAAFLLMVPIVGGCANSEGGANAERPSVLSQVFRPDFSARSPRSGSNNGVSGSQGNQEIAASRIFGASNPGIDGTVTGQTPTSTNGGVQLNFEDADLREFIDTVLGQTLQLNYTVDPSVSGTVTLSTARPIGRDSLLELLEAVLRVNGAELTRSGETYQVIEATSATASRVDYARAGAGYGLSIIPLQFISPQTLSQLINGFGARPGSLRVETTRNLLIVLGSSADRRSAIETATAFDVDWMQDQSVGILTMRTAKPEAVIPELERIFAAQGGGSGSSVIQFMPMPRLQAVLAVSQNRSLIERAQTWVERLDRENADLDESVHVYRLKYREASVVAELLNQLFQGQSASSSASSLAPAEDLTLAASEPLTQGEQLIDAAFGDDNAVSGAFTVASQPVQIFNAPTASGGIPRIQPDTSNNSIIIYGDLDARQRALSALGRIDVPQLQVAINITMAEVRLTDELRYGVQYFVKSQNVGLGSDNGSIGLFNTLADNIARELPGFNFVVGSESSPDIIINALDAVTDVQVLSSPSLVVMENEEARFQVGDQIPIVTRTVTSVEDANAPVSNQVEYRDTGIIMRVRPRISEDGIVTMRIEQEISAVSSNAGTLTPVISNRSISSNVAVVDGQTVLLGGLIRDQSEAGKDGIPGLRRMRGIGNLFGSTNRSNERTELLILIRPSVIRDGKDAQTVAEELQSRMWELGPRSIKR